MSVPYISFHFLQLVISKVIRCVYLQIFAPIAKISLNLFTSLQYIQYGLSRYTYVRLPASEGAAVVSIDSCTREELEQHARDARNRRDLLDPHYMPGPNANPNFVFDAAFVEFV